LKIFTDRSLKNQGDGKNRGHSDAYFLLINVEYRQKINRLIVDVLQISTDIDQKRKCESRVLKVKFSQFVIGINHFLNCFFDINEFKDR